MRVIRHLASASLVSMAVTITYPSHVTLVTWFQLGELRLWAMGLTSESGRWPDPLPMLLLGFGGWDIGVIGNESKAIRCLWCISPCSSPKYVQIGEWIHKR
jgi:hypothetical protein